MPVRPCTDRKANDAEQEYRNRRYYKAHERIVIESSLERLVYMCPGLRHRHRPLHSTIIVMQSLKVI